MTDFRTTLANLRRPRLLIRAARHGMTDYRRERDLRRLVSAFTPEGAVPELIKSEEHLEQIRQTGDASYSVSRHIEVLIALMSEARLLPRLA